MALPQSRRPKARNAECKDYMFNPSLSPGVRLVETPGMVPMVSPGSNPVERTRFVSCGYRQGSLVSARDRGVGEGTLCGQRKGVFGYDLSLAIKCIVNASDLIIMVNGMKNVTLLLT